VLEVQPALEAWSFPRSSPLGPLLAGSTQTLAEYVTVHGFGHQFRDGLMGNKELATPPASSPAGLVRVMAIYLGLGLLAALAVVAMRRSRTFSHSPL